MSPKPQERPIVSIPHDTSNSSESHPLGCFAELHDKFPAHVHSRWSPPVSSHFQQTHAGHLPCVVLPGANHSGSLITHPFSSWFIDSEMLRREYLTGCLRGSVTYPSFAETFGIPYTPAVLIGGHRGASTNDGLILTTTTCQTRRGTNNCGRRHPV